MQRVEVGSIVTFRAPTSRNEEGQFKTVPGIVLAQHPDGSLQLFAFNFECSYLVQAIRLEDVDIIFNRADLAARLAELEQLGSGTRSWRTEQPKFALALERDLESR